MISVICVYNDREVLGKCLLNSLTRQSVQFEFIPVDNREAKYASAAAALNAGARIAGNKWLCFIHQDVAFLSDHWLEQAEALLEDFEPQGWIGVAGISSEAVFCGFLRDRDRLFGDPFDGLVEVQTLDECLLIHRRIYDDETYFDEGLIGWHAYGVEACCRAIKAGHRNYVVSLPVWHNSQSSNISGLEESHRYVWEKHSDYFDRILTTCGVLPDSYAWDNSASFRQPRLADRIIYRIFSAFGFTVKHENTLEDMLEDILGGTVNIDVLHSEASMEQIDACGFAFHSRRPRLIRHHFFGFKVSQLHSDLVLIMPCLIKTVPDVEYEVMKLLEYSPSIILCLRLSDIARSLRMLSLVLLHASRRWLNISAVPFINLNGDGRYYLVVLLDSASF